MLKLSSCSCCSLNALECLEYLTCFQFIGTAAMHWTAAQAARFTHVLIILSVYLFAIILGFAYPSYFDGGDSSSSMIDLSSGCEDDYLDTCIYRQLIYRASFALVIISTILAVVVPWSSFIHGSLWMIKIVLSFGLFIAFWFVENTFFSLYAQFARHVAIFWLVIQALLLADLVYDAHEHLMDTASNQEREEGKTAYDIYTIYIILCLVGFLASIFGIVYLYKDYSACYLGLVFTSVTLVLGVITTLISLWYPVNRGALTPCIMFAYCVFKCWYALLSDPSSSCYIASSEDDSYQSILAFIIIFIVTMIVVLYSVFNGTELLNAFDLTQGEGVLRSYRVNSRKKQVSSSSSPSSSSSLPSTQENEWKSLLTSTRATTTTNPIHASSTKLQLPFDYEEDHLR
jgi:hypothetical protein